MACYGLAKALLELGVEIDLVLPTLEEVYFPLRKPEDADIMPIKYLNPSRRIEEVISVQNQANLIERLRMVGVMTYPESYTTPGFNFEKSMGWVWSQQIQKYSREVSYLQTHLRGEEKLFKKVQEFTARLVKYAPQLQFDLIHAHDWLTYPAGILMKGMSGKKLVTHIHATEFDRAGGPGDERIHNIEYTGLSTADRVIAVSNYTAQMIIDRYQIDPHKIDIVHNAYSTIKTEEAIQRKKMFRDPLVLFLGRVTIQKGPDYFLDVADRVIQKFPKVRFVMAGSGDMFQKTLLSAARRKLKDRFLFTGFLNREEVEEILSATDIYVMPSVSEPFGIAPLEAMAFGAVAIVSKQSGVQEVIENAYKIDFWDVEKTAGVILELLEDPEKRRNLAAAGRAEVLAIGWKTAAEKAKKTYEATLCST